MCPLFAANGSPWTGDKNAPCIKAECGWWKGFGGDGCDGCTAALTQIEDVREAGRTLQLGPIRQKREETAPREYDCPRASECQWQIECAPALCPPRYALSKGIDPRACAW
jgi:hypothetical protein